MAFWNFWKQIKNKFQFSHVKRVEAYRDECSLLIGKYETLLQEISEYMGDNQFALEVMEEKKELLEENENTFHFSSFSFLLIKDQLVNITQECNTLLEKGEEQIGQNPYFKNIVDPLLAQLEKLRTYSEQIEDALSGYEEKLMEMEEVLSSQTLWN